MHAYQEKSAAMAMGAGYCGTATAAPPVQRPALETIQAELESVTNQLLNLESQVGAFNQRLGFPSDVVGEAKNSPTPVPSGIVERLHKEVQTVQRVVNRLGEYIYKLEKVA